MSEQTRRHNAKRLGTLLWTDDGMVFDLPERRQVATVRPTTEALLLRAAGRELLVEAELKELRARDLRTGELLWETPLKSWVGSLAVAPAAGRVFLGMSGVKKWGGGERKLVDAATGRFVEEDVLGPRFERASGVGRYFGSAEEDSHFASVERDRLRVHRATDGATVAQYELSAEPAPTTEITAEGHRVTTQIFDFRESTSMHFGAAGFLLVSNERVQAYDYTGAAVGAAARPPRTTLYDAQWHQGGWNLLLEHAAPGRPRDVVRLEDAQLRPVWTGCEGLALLGDEIVTQTLAVASLAARQAVGTLALATPGRPTPRRPGRIEADAPLLALLARLRCASKATKPTGLSLAALQEVEKTLGRELPSWALAVLAAQLRCLATGLKLELAQLVAHTEALRAMGRLQSEVELPPGLVVLGGTVVLNKRRKGLERGYSRKDTHWWCADGERSVVVAQLEFAEFAYGKELAEKNTVQVELRGARDVSELLAPVLHAQREKNTVALGGAARLAELEAAAVTALTELALTA